MSVCFVNACLNFLFFIFLFPISLKMPEKSLQNNTLLRFERLLVLKLYLNLKYKMVHLEKYQL